MKMVVVDKPIKMEIGTKLMFLEITQYRIKGHSGLMKAHNLRKSSNSKTFLRSLVGGLTLPSMMCRIKILILKLLNHKEISEGVAENLAKYTISLTKIMRAFGTL